VLRALRSAISDAFREAGIQVPVVQNMHTPPEGG
jgi:hypothetical protein